MTMTSEAKGQLSKTIRSLREKLLTELSEATDREYLLSIRSPKLDSARSTRRKRLQDWLDAQVRSQTGKLKRTKEEFRRDAEKQAAYTLLNRLVILRVLEATGLRKPKVITGGWNSPGYKDFRELAQALVRNDDSEGYSFLLQLIFEDLAMDLPGLYGTVGVVDLIPVPSSTIRTVIEALDDPQLESCWTDDMTLGWVYQYWNDPEREALDAKINDGGKIEPHEIASKTQMFTERYMVDWLLQNSLGPMWLAMCKKQGWTPEVEADGTLQRLEERRIEWRAKREERQSAIVSFRSAKGDAAFAERKATIDESTLPGVSLTDLMPLETDAERRWAYYVPQPIPDDAVQNAPNSVRDLKILDPAVGSGHFLVVAFDLLFALYQEEARHRKVGRTKERSDDVPAAPGDNDEDAGTALRLVRPTDFDESHYTPEAITQRILEHNLHGVDLDPRAVQIAAAALWMKAQNVAFRSAKESSGTAPQTFTPIRIGSLNLVASNLGIASLPDNDPSLVELRRAVEAETGIPAKLTNQIIEALRGADHLGSLLKVDAAIEGAIAEHERSLDWDNNVKQLNLFPDGRIEQKQFPFPKERLQRNFLAMLEQFLSRHTSAQELGLRLAGEQLAAGVRFVRIVKEGAYDLVVANPPYQGTSKMADAKYVGAHYKMAKADLFAAFLLRGMELVREHGVSAMLTMRNWMFIKQYSELRQHLLQRYDLRALGDLSSGAFQEINAAQVVVSVAMACFWRDQNTGGEKVAIRPFSDDTLLKPGETERKRAATLCHVGRHTFDPAALKVVPEWPLVYWWDEELDFYATYPLIGSVARARAAQSTGNNQRFLRCPWEAVPQKFFPPGIRASELQLLRWHPFVNGAESKAWIEPLSMIIRWEWNAIHVKLSKSHKTGLDSFTLASEDFFYQLGVAFSSTGSGFQARQHRYASVYDVKGQSAFPNDPSEVVCCLNSTRARAIVCDLNPTISFQVGDINRIPLLPVCNSKNVFEQIEGAFSVHESHREPSVEFKQPGSSPWRHAQEWAQLAVDRPEGEPLPEYVEVLDPEPATDHVSFAVGVALGRFWANGEGILESRLSLRESRVRAIPDDTSSNHRNSEDKQNNTDATFAERKATLPNGILFLNGSLTDEDTSDSLGHEAAEIILDKWAEYGRAIDARRSVRTWLREKFFSDVHKGMYENRPIHWPLSSAKKTFVAWINIHRWNEQTLRVIQADHLEPALKQLDGEIEDLNKVRSESHFAPRNERDFRGAKGDKSRAAEDRYDDVKAWRDELVEFIANVQQCSERGPAPPDAKKPEREVDARYIPDLDDGVMVNSSALWPLLDPQWKDPKKWWKELVAAKGKKDYDWSHLAMRYFPKRVDAKCQTDPSLGVAHGCFWKYHPAKAWAWELRLQDEIGPDFRIEEAEYTLGTYRRPATSENRKLKTENSAPGRSDIVLRAEYLQNNPKEALTIIEKEVLRRRRKQKRRQTELRLLEPGLWSSSPADCWELELGLIDKQQVEFRLLSPDEPAARSAFESAHPELVQARKALLSRLKPPDLYAEEEEEADLVAEVDEEITDDES